MSLSGSQPVDLSMPQKSSDITNSVSVPHLPPAPVNKRSGTSSIFGAPNPSRIQSFDTFNAAGQPVLDLHSALNGIQKSFTIGSGNQSRHGQQLLPPPPLMRNIGRNGTNSNGGNSRSSSSGSNMSPSPPPCPPPNNMHLWASLAAASSFGKTLEQNFAAFNIPTHNFTPPQYLGYPGCPGNDGVPSKSMRTSSGCSIGIASQLTDSHGSIRDSTSLSTSSPVVASASSAGSQMSKYNQLLTLLDEMSKDIRPSYAGSKSSAERLKRGIAHARILVREAEIEADRNARN